MADPRRQREYKAIFNNVVDGKPLKDSQSHRKLFLDSISNHQDPPHCIGRIVNKEHVHQTLRTCVSSDITAAFYNSTITSLITFLMKPELKIVGGGDYLRTMVRIIAESPAFWISYSGAFESGELVPDAEYSFAWFLFQLLQLDDSEPYRPFALKQAVQDRLSGIADPAGRDIVAKILSTLSVTGPPPPPTSEVSTPGGRHNNDFEDFRQISILPTTEEINCTAPPFLRRSVYLDDPNTEPNRPVVYLDNTFRLLREDMLYELREEISLIFGKKGKRRRQILEGLQFMNIHAPAFEGKAKLLGQAAFEMQYPGPLPQLKGDSTLGTSAKRAKHLKDNFQGKKLYKHGSLCCLIFDGKVAAFPTLIRDEARLSQDKAIFLLEVKDKRIAAQLLVDLKVAKKIDLVLADVAVFAYEPVLLALQKMKYLPFEEELLFWTDDKNLNMVDMSPELETRTRELSRYRKTDLSRHIDTKSIVLDDAQMKSLLAGLCQRVSLIQGPPGNVVVSYYLSVR